MLTTGILGTNFNLKSIIKDTIKSTLMNRLSLTKRIMLKRIVYFPTYTTCDITREKSISSIYLKVKGRSSYEKMPIKEIEMTGATIIEFIDYLNENGAFEVTNIKEILELV